MDYVINPRAVLTMFLPWARMLAAVYVPWNILSKYLASDGETFSNQIAKSAFACRMHHSSIVLFPLIGIWLMRWLP